jgi:hypothetical protein
MYTAVIHFCGAFVHEKLLTRARLGHCQIKCNIKVAILLLKVK